MQVIQHYFGEVLSPVVGHVNTRHKLTALAGSHASLFAQYRTVNAFHLFGSKETQYEELSINAKTESGVVMAVEHVKAPVFGIMWHPEREKPYCSIDVELFKNVFYGKSGFHGENA
jgi:putative glutamine amidotransferase